MFKVGDYVMGKDRSYRRSLYRVQRVLNNDMFDLQFIILGDRVGEPHEISTDRYQDQFAMATAFDIKTAYAWKQTNSLMDLLIKLKIDAHYGY